MQFKCPRCGIEALKKYARPLALPTLAIDPASGEWVIDPAASFGVTANYCETCKYVEFEHITDDGLKSFLQDRIQSILE